MKEKPLRMCISCRTMKPKDALIRVVKTSEGIFVDKTGKRNGRGAYICKEGHCVELLAKNKALNRAFQCEVDSDVIEGIKKELSNGANELG
jgi:predicted RNA-binding protein YlxR (DUF448 family)